MTTRVLTAMASCFNFTIIFSSAFTGLGKVKRTCLWRARKLVSIPIKCYFILAGQHGPKRILQCVSARGVVFRFKKIFVIFEHLIEQHE